MFTATFTLIVSSLLTAGLLAATFTYCEVNGLCECIRRTLNPLMVVSSGSALAMVSVAGFYFRRAKALVKIGRT